MRNFLEEAIKTMVKLKYAEEYADLNPQEITVLDPCMGSGHFLTYAFDVLMEIYRECGYSARDAVKEHNRT